MLWGQQRAEVGGEKLSRSELSGQQFTHSHQLAPLTLTIADDWVLAVRYCVLTLVLTAGFLTRQKFATSSTRWSAI